MSLDSRSTVNIHGRIFIATAIALLMFAANSVLCRLALIDTDINANSFTLLRLASAALMLAFILLAQQPKTFAKRLIGLKQHGSWLASAMLFAYAACFSLAYISLDAANGALVLFMTMQVTMLVLRIARADYLSGLEWLGFITACLGFAYWLWRQAEPAASISHVSAQGVVLMTLAGLAWAIYTLKGQGSTTPQLDTSANFIRSLVFASVLLPWFVWPEPKAVYLALAAGALSSGLGYVVWYYAVAGLSLTQAAVSQLLVPLITALGGFIWAGESLSLELVVAMLVVLGGMLLITLGRKT